MEVRIFAEAGKPKRLCFSRIERALDEREVESIKSIDGVTSAHLVKEDNGGEHPPAPYMIAVYLESRCRRPHVSEQVVRLLA